MFILSILLLFIGISGTLYYLPFTLYQLDNNIGSSILEFIYNSIPVFKPHIINTMYNIQFGNTTPLIMLIISILFITTGILISLHIRKRRSAYR
jgi:hypothetical protein